MHSPQPRTDGFQRLLITACLLILPAALQSPDLCHALLPEEVLIIANSNVPESVQLARYYQKRRQIPEKNILLLKTTDQESCSRTEYETDIAAPINDFLKKHPGKAISCLTLIYGLPLRILPPPISDASRKTIDKLSEQRSAIEKNKDSAATSLLNSIKKDIARLSGADQEASLDSELALARLAPYPLAGWQLNPLFVGLRDKSSPFPREMLLLVSRIDGPDAAVAKRIIDDSIEAEEKGLSGTAYFDAQWNYPKNREKLSGYSIYDKSLHDAARHLSQKGYSVELDAKPELFQAGWGLKAALYCGWYSLARYVDAFAWQKGSVGYHIASGECRTLKEKESSAWCKMMLEKGIAATLGPVSEPYVQSFPLPEIFFSLLIRGDLTLAECYALSNPFLSWKMVLIADPLYRPFAINAAQNSVTEEGK